MDASAAQSTQMSRTGASSLGPRWNVSPEHPTDRPYIFPSVRSNDRFPVVFWAHVTLVFSALFFVLTMYSMVFSKFLPRTGNKFLDLISNDVYYCYLVPLTLPVTVVSIYTGWVGMKFFRHN